MGVDNTEIIEQDPPGGNNRRWVLPAVLAAILVAVLAGAYFAKHPHMFGGSPTSTPTVRPTAKPQATSTPKVVAAATATPRPVATSTPRPAPTPTPTAKPAPVAGGKPTARPTAPRPTAVRPTAVPPTAVRPTTPPSPQPSPTSTVKIGAVQHPQSTLNAIQQGANRNDPTDVLYLDPAQVVSHNLGNYGFGSGFTVISPPPGASATATPYANTQGVPEVKFVVQFQGKRYTILLDQLVQHGPKGIWVIISIQIGG